MGQSKQWHNATGNRTTTTQQSSNPAPSCTKTEHLVHSDVAEIREATLIPLAKLRLGCLSHCPAKCHPQDNEY